MGNLIIISEYIVYEIEMIKAKLLYYSYGYISEIQEPAVFALYLI